MKKMFERLVIGLERLNEMENGDFIGELYEDRAESIHTKICKEIKHKESTESIRAIDEEIEEKFGKQYWEVIRLVERYENAIAHNAHICEKLMYKYGMMDGIRLVIEAIRPIDVRKFIEEDNK